MQHSPFAAIQNNIMYPNRIVTTDKKEAKAHIQKLIDDGIISKEYLKSVNIGQIKFEILLNINPLDISDIIGEII